MGRAGGVYEKCGAPVAHREVLLEQRAQIDDTLNRLDYKISRYEEALKTGKLTWE